MMIGFVSSRIERKIDSAINSAIASYHGNKASSFAQALGIPSHITPRERLKLRELAKGRRQIAEIGSYIGASAAAMASAERPEDSKIYCIDTWQNDAMSEGKRDTFKEFLDNTIEFSSAIVPIRGYSQKVAPALFEKTDSLDMLFIDGDHSYEGALSDWELYSPLLRQGSIVAFHDYGWAEGVKRVTSKHASKFARRVGRLPNLWWAELGVAPHPSNHPGP